MDSSALLQSTYALRLRAASLLYTLWVGEKVAVSATQPKYNSKYFD